MVFHWKKLSMLNYKLKQFQIYLIDWSTNEANTKKSSIWISHRFILSFSFKYLTSTLQIQVRLESYTGNSFNANRMKLFKILKLKIAIIIVFLTLATGIEKYPSWESGMSYLVNAMNSKCSRVLYYLYKYGTKQYLYSTKTRRLSALRTPHSSVPYNVYRRKNCANGTATIDGNPSNGEIHRESRGAAAQLHRLRPIVQCLERNQLVEVTSIGTKWHNRQETFNSFKQHLTLS